MHCIIDGAKLAQVKF